jgi:hypothetical protein
MAGEVRAPRRRSLRHQGGFEVSAFVLGGFEVSWAASRCQPLFFVFRLTTGFLTSSLLGGFEVSALASRCQPLFFGFEVSAFVFGFSLDNRFPDL